MFESLGQDLRFAVRSLTRRPLFLLVSVFSISIGIGANTAIFSAVSRFVLRPPQGIPNAERVVEVGRGRDSSRFDSFSYPDFLDLRGEAGPLQALAGFDMRALTVSQGAEGERVFGLLVSANYFDVLGIGPLMGRTFLPEEDEGADDHPVVILAHSFWQEALGGDPEIVGSTLYVSRQPYTVVGVTPEGFRGHVALAEADIFVPFMQYPSLNEGRNLFDQRGSSWFNVLGLLRPGASAEEANAAVSVVFSRLADEYPETNAGRTGAVRPFRALPAVLRGPVALFLTALLTLVGLLLLLTCSNVAGMFLARASSRRREIAIRLSMGSSRRRLIRHLLTESLLVFMLGGAGGILMAVWALDLLSAFDLPAVLPISLRLSPDSGVLAFSILLTLVTGIVFGILPARQALDLDLLSTLKGEGARAGSAEGRLRRAFVTAQVGASLVLLVASGLFLRALQHAGEIETGFEAEGAYLTTVDLATEGYDSEEGAVFQEELLAYYSAQPWVESVSLSIDLPLDMGSYGTHVIPDGWESGSGLDFLRVEFNDVSAEYFETLQIPVLQGRVFREMDREETEPVAVVSRRFVREVWPGESALGKRVLWGTGGDDYLTVIGVVEDVQNQLLTEDPRPFLYRPLLQHYRAETNLVIRTDLEPVSARREIQAGLRGLEPNLSLSPVIDLQRYTAVGILPQRVAGTLATVLGLLALFLSGMGVYGVMAQTVNRRTREVGIRVALGAEPGRVLRSVLGGAFRLALPGLVVGVVLAGGVSVLLRSLLLGISPMDPVALAGVMGAMALMVLAGTLAPARRAARVDPAEALRHE